MATSTPAPLTPGQRLLRLLGSEGPHIAYLYVYAALAGLVSLTLPLGVQSVIGFVSSGAVSSSLVVLIGFIVVGTLLLGGLQVMQVYLVEFMQQRLFARLALDFAVRLPRVRTEALNGQYLPELMNRLLDVPTLQKGLATLLVEFSAAALQVLFGLLLLSFYHPVFIAFGLLLVALLALLIRLTGARGLRTSLAESKYKYQVVAWLEDVARTVHTFRHPPQQALALRRTDELVTGYLGARQSHFRVLLAQYWGFVVFKTLITAGLLTIGCALLVGKQLNIGQFVAAEIVILLVINAVEKVLLKLDVVYDALTALDKIGHVLDLPVLGPAPDAGSALALAPPGRGLAVAVQQLSYAYPAAPTPALQQLTLAIGAGEHVGLTGGDGAGTAALLRVLAGLLDGFTGVVTFDGHALQDLAPAALGQAVGDTLSHQHLFEGTLLQNLTLDHPGITPEDVAWALDLVGLRDDVHARPLGLRTPVGIGTPLAGSTRQKLLLARALVHRPRLLLLDGFLPGAPPAERHRVLDRLLAPAHPWTVVLASTNPRELGRCPRLLVLRGGRLVADGPHAQVMSHPEMHALLGE